MTSLDNGPANSISRGNLSLLFTQVSNAAREPPPIPEELWTLLVREQPARLAVRKVESFYLFLQKGLDSSTRKCNEAGQ